MMKTIKLFFISTLILAAGCAGELTAPKSVTQADAATLMTRAGGTYELYSWKDGEEWNFILVSGTTRMSSFAEIVAANKAIGGVDGFIRVLGTMPKGTTILWNLREIKGFSFPDSKALEEIQSAADSRSINLQAIERL